MLKCGDAFLMAQPRVTTPHLWIMLTAATSDTDKAIIVNVTSLRDGSDTTVVLKPGDHPFIAKESVIYFHGALVVDLVRIQEAFSARVCKPQPSCSPDLLARIQRGLLKSQFTPEGIATFYRKRAAGTASSKDG
jgi:hypothetical protein